MGGILGFVSSEPREIKFEAALDSICHSDVFMYGRYVTTSRLHLGSVYRENDKPKAYWDQEEGIGILAYGHLIDSDNPTRLLSAERIYELYERDGIEALTRFDGGFIISVLDLREKCLILINDRMGTIPTQYMAQDAFFAFAPEAKAITHMLGMQPRLDPTSVLTFLNMGHALGSHTLFDEIHLLEPAQIVRLSIESARKEISTYWKLSFNYGNRRSISSAADELDEILNECHRRSIADEPTSLQLLLSGGYDSRTLLGKYTQIRRKPDECVTWGISDNITRSDPSIALQLAADNRIPCRFLFYDGSEFPNHASNWAFISELGSDNLGSFAVSDDFVYRDGIPVSVVAVGDQMLGTSGLSLSRADAIEIVSGIPRNGISPGLNLMLRNERTGEFQGIMISQLDDLADRCDAEKPKDLQDCLGIHIRIARWLNAPSYFREPMVSTRRPMLMLPAIEFFRSLPPEIRVDKRILVIMLRRRMPELLRYPFTATNSLVDWDFLFTTRGPVRTYIENLIDNLDILEDTIHPFIDMKSLMNYGRTYLNKTFLPIQRRPVPERILPDLRRIAGRYYLSGLAFRVVERGMKSLMHKSVGANNNRVLKRFLLLVLLQQCIERGMFINHSIESDKKSRQTQWEIEA